jgi:hypothetical protein
MKLKRLKIYYYFWIAALLMVFELIFNADIYQQSLGIDFIFNGIFEHVNLNLVGSAAAAFYVLNGLAYWYIQEQLDLNLNTVLIKIHSFIFLFGIMVCFIFIKFDRYIEHKEVTEIYLKFNYYLKIVSLLITAAALIIAQPIFIINLLKSNHKKQRDKHQLNPKK